MTSGPYKSKTLNLISEKHRQILDQSDRAFRHLKLAGSNTLQLLLYPIYVLVQTSRLAVKELKQIIFKHIPQIPEKIKKKSLNHQTVDQDIPQILTTVSETGVKQTETSSIAKSQTTSQSEIFTANSIPNLAVESKDLLLEDNLTLVQQKQLQHIPIQQTAQLQLKPYAEITPNFGPINKLWQVMAWVQTSQIALWFNLFGEVNLLPPTNQPKQQPLIGNTTPLLSNSNFTFYNFIHNSARQYLYPLTTGLGLNGLLPPFETEQLSLDEILLEEMAKSSQQMSFPGQHEKRIVASAVYPFQSEKLDNNSQTTVAPLKNNTLIQTHKNQNKLSFTRETSQISPQSKTTESLPRHQPNWLEVKSISIGYIKHPLEEILAWVDVIMTWLETAIAAVWQWTQNKLQNF